MMSLCKGCPVLAALMALFNRRNVLWEPRKGAPLAADIAHLIGTSHPDLIGWSKLSGGCLTAAGAHRVARFEGERRADDGAVGGSDGAGRAAMRPRPGAGFRHLAAAGFGIGRQRRSAVERAGRRAAAALRHADHHD